VKTTVSALLAAALLAGCGSSGDDSKDDGSTAPETPAPSADSAVFRSKDVGFTFAYPRSFDIDRRPEGQVLGQVSADAGGRINALKIRKTSDRELGPDRYLDEFQRDFERTVGAVEKRKEQVGDLETGVLEFTDQVEQAGEQVEFTSTSYFFKGGGGTWQLECIADSEHRAAIDDACHAALESVRFRPA
jgi:hypothetical protein